MRVHACVCVQVRVSVLIRVLWTCPPCGSYRSHCSCGVSRASYTWTCECVRAWTRLCGMAVSFSIRYKRMDNSPPKSVYACKCSCTCMKKKKISKKKISKKKKKKKIRSVLLVVYHNLLDAAFVCGVDDLCGEWVAAWGACVASLVVGLHACGKGRG